MKEHQLPPALRKPIPTPPPSVEPSTPSVALAPPTVAGSASPALPPIAPALNAASPAPTPELPPSKKLDGWEPIPTPKELGMKPLSPLPAALRPQTGSPRPPTLGRPASTPKPQPKSAPTPSTGGTITRTIPAAVVAAPYNPRIPVLDRIAMFEGTFVPEGGKPFCVETPLTGNGPQDKASLVALARKVNPRSSLRLASTRIYTRDPGTPATYPAGTTCGQLFGEAGSDTEAGIEVGHVFFQGERCQVTLRNLRSRNCVTVALRPPGGGQIVFSNQIAANRLAKELAYLVKEILGNEARELEITLKEAK